MVNQEFTVLPPRIRYWLRTPLQIVALIVALIVVLKVAAHSPAEQKTYSCYFFGFHNSGHFCLVAIYSLYFPVFPDDKFEAVIAAREAGYIGEAVGGESLLVQFNSIPPLLPFIHESLTYTKD